MAPAADSDKLAKLIEMAHRQTLASFEKEVSEGTRDPRKELAEYRRRRRDYATLLRMGRIPDEAGSLAEQLLQSHSLVLDGSARQAFDHDVAGLLIRLYDDFIERATNHGSR